jgi:hypothetical protein
MANPENLAQSRQHGSAERGGLGQSGYTAGRREGDVALDAAIDTQYAAPPGSGSGGLGLDDRFTGRGGPVSEVEPEGHDETAAQPYPHTSGAPDPETSEPDGDTGRDAGADDALDRGGRVDRAGERPR